MSRAILACGLTTLTILFAFGCLDRTGLQIGRDGSSDDGPRDVAEDADASDCSDSGCGSGGSGSGGSGSGGDAGTGGAGGSGSGGAPGSGGAGGEQGTGGASGSGGTAGCTKSSECGTGQYCNLTVCGATSGMCSPLPTSCGNSYRPVCGCNNVTYWNDCLRRRNGVESSTQGVCGSGALQCSYAGGCPSGAVCGFLRGAITECANDNTPGQCWVLPGDCPVASATTRRCDLGPSSSCTTPCDAIRDQQPYYIVSAPATCGQ